MRTAIVILLVLMNAQALAQVIQREGVINFPFSIAGGTKTLMLPVSASGPLPAEDRRVRIDVAGFRISKGNTTTTITWMFSFTSKREQAIEQVVVEELSAATPLVMVRDDAPNLSDKSWHGSSEEMDASQQSQPWLYAEGLSVFVFKFTIKCRGKSPLVYYQPAWFPTAAKAAMIRAPNRDDAQR